MTLRLGPYVLTIRWERRALTPDEERARLMARAIFGGFLPRPEPWSVEPLRKAPVGVKRPARKPRPRRKTPAKP